MKTVVSIAILLITALLFSCSDNPLDSVQESVAGTYLVSGQQINMEVCWAPGANCEPREILSRDTIQTSFEVQIDVVKNKADTLWFTGLEGVDISVQNADFTGRAAFSGCVIESDCPYAKFTNGTIEFDLTYWQYRYYGSGILINGKLKINTHYRYRGDGVDYILEGEKIEE